MRLRLATSSLRETKPSEYAQRFVFGGVVTVFATLIAQKWGPVVGGMFLAFPGIFPPGISLTEKHKVQREAEQGKDGQRSARSQAAVEATGASEGAIGLAVFGLLLWKVVPAHGLAIALASAVAAWAVVSCLAWWVRERL